MRSTISFSRAMSSRCCRVSSGHRPSSLTTTSAAVSCASRSAANSTRLTAAFSARSASFFVLASIRPFRCAPTNRSKSYKHSKSASLSKFAPNLLLQR
ncbi:ORF148 peptide [Hyphantria cunea nucleopolyhedrovirus]|uniref:ORF148 peptide n=1 Tax=Hyphantria cunea nuclear polyhedrosis virus TaxID=28288 RepID=Q2NP50_NPVHC|nr:ORF148 peptide [Hyphantria cunea nucleopolyhedrovirus]BAE72437.1 ORF148 peptide [Hyphantria cunea nucleopolyhedrovirus]